MFGNYTAQAGVIAFSPSFSPNIINAKLTWNFNDVIVFDFVPYGRENINDRPRINIWRSVNDIPDFNNIIYISGGRNVLSPAPTGRIIQTWGDRRTGEYIFNSISVNNSDINWILEKKITGDFSQRSFFGQSVDINGNGTKVIVGGPNFNNDRGSILLYSKNQNEWNLTRKIDGSDTKDFFGASVNISNDGNLFVAGAPGTPSVPKTGSAFVYTGNQLGEWNLQKQLTGFKISSFFGNNVVINKDQNIILVSAFANSLAGSVFVYTGSPTTTWNLKQEITGEIFTWFGLTGRYGDTMSISNNGNIIAIGGILPGQPILTYTGNINNGWIFKQRLSGIDNDETLLNPVSMDGMGSGIVIGTNLDKFYVYTGNQNLGWFPQKTVSNFYNTIQNTFHDLKINNNGDTIIFGAEKEDTVFTPVCNSGKVFIFNKKEGPTDWVLNREISSNICESTFGTKLDIDDIGNTLIISSPYEDQIAPGFSGVGAARIYSKIGGNNSIIAGIDLFTHSFALPKTATLMPPLNQWTIKSEVPGETQYQYKFNVGQTTPQINIELEYQQNCNVVLPNCQFNEETVYLGNNISGCPVFECYQPFSPKEYGLLYNINTWSGAGLAGFGNWSFSSGSGSRRDISDSSQLDRESIGFLSFFTVGNTGSTNTTHTVNFDLTENITSGASLSLDANYAWNGGTREIILKGANSINQYRFTHGGNDSLRYNRVSIPNGSPQILNSTITGNIFRKAVKYQISNLGTGFRLNIFYPHNSNNILYSDIVTGNNINWNNFVTGITFSSSLSNSPIQDWYNYGMYFNNIELNKTPSIIFILTNNDIVQYYLNSNQFRKLGSIMPSFDIAHTNNKLWVWSNSKIQEYNITSNPWSINFNRSITILNLSFNVGAGLGYKKHNKLLLGRSAIYEIDITTDEATPALLFALPAGFIVTGDILYIEDEGDISIGLIAPFTYLITYNLENGSDYRLGLFNSSGTLTQATALPFNNAYGIFKANNSYYLVRGTGEIYLINNTDLSIEFVKKVNIDQNLEINGASSI